MRESCASQKLPPCCLIPGLCSRAGNAVPRDTGQSGGSFTDSSQPPHRAAQLPSLHPLTQEDLPPTGCYRRGPGDRSLQPHPLLAEASAHRPGQPSSGLPVGPGESLALTEHRARFVQRPRLVPRVACDVQPPAPCTPVGQALSHQSSPVAPREWAETAFVPDPGPGSLRDPSQLGQACGSRGCVGDSGSKASGADRGVWTSPAQPS